MDYFNTRSHTEVLLLYGAGHSQSVVVGCVVQQEKLEAERQEALAQSELEFAWRQREACKEMQEMLVS